MRLTVIGTGYVGLVTGACFAEMGNDVTCVDIDSTKIAGLKQGVLPIYEPGLDTMVTSNAAAGRLSFTTSLAEALAQSEIYFIAVGTPPNEDGSADLSHVLAVAQEIGRHLGHYAVVIDKSTVPVGTAERVRDAIAEELSKRGQVIPFDVVSNPEFLKEGDAIADFMRPDRVVVGCESDTARDIMRDLYGTFMRNHERLLFMDIRAAEMTKYAANAMLATRISFMNELALLAERLGADIERVRQGIGSDPRIGYQFLYPGCGYGGSCFPKDVQALQRTATENGLDLRILEAVETVNERQKAVLLDKIDAHFGESLKGKCFALWGLAFKPNTDDMREAPARVLIEGLLQRGATLRAFDPVAMEEARHIFGQRSGLSFVESAEEAVEGADALVVVTEWQVFRSPDFEHMARSLRAQVIFDGRNLYEPHLVRAAGLTYHGIGRL